MMDGNARLSHPVKFPGIEINAIFVDLRGGPRHLILFHILLYQLI